MDIIINDAILHILDSSSDVPVYSKERLIIEDEKIKEFLEKHIIKIFNDQSVKIGVFHEESQVKNMIKNIREGFINHSISIAEMLHRLMLKYIEIPSGDILIAHININNEDYLLLIKFNYKEGYTHYVEYGEYGTANRIIVNKVMFPSSTQKDLEVGLINLNDLSIKVFEKEYEIEGQKVPYFSKLFLQIDTELSLKESINIVRSTARELTKRYYNDDFNKLAEIKEAIYDDLDSGAIEVEEVANKIFKNSPEIKKEYIETVKNEGVGRTIDLQGKRPEKKLTVHKIKMDNGIQLDIPVDIYRDKNIVEFINNPDGTISLIIKNISKIKQD